MLPKPHVRETHHHLITPRESVRRGQEAKMGSCASARAIYASPLLMSAHLGHDTSHLLEPNTASS